MRTASVVAARFGHLAQRFESCAVSGRPVFGAPLGISGTRESMAMNRSSLKTNLRVLNSRSVVPAVGSFCATVFDLCTQARQALSWYTPRAETQTSKRSRRCSTLLKG